jgi:hypothetical protein
MVVCCARIQIEHLRSTNTLSYCGSLVWCWWVSYGRLSKGCKYCNSRNGHPWTCSWGPSGDNSSGVGKQWVNLYKECGWGAGSWRRSGVLACWPVNGKGMKNGPWEGPALKRATPGLPPALFGGCRTWDKVFDEEDAEMRWRWHSERWRSTRCGGDEVTGACELTGTKLVYELRAGRMPCSSLHVFSIWYLHPGWRKCEVFVLFLNHMYIWSQVFVMRGLTCDSAHCWELYSAASLGHHSVSMKWCLAQ